MAILFFNMCGHFGAVHISEHEKRLPDELIENFRYSVCRPRNFRNSIAKQPFTVQQTKTLRHEIENQSILLKMFDCQQDERVQPIHLHLVANAKKIDNCLGTTEYC